MGYVDLGKLKAHTGKLPLNKELKYELVVNNKKVVVKIHKGSVL